jgi:hypothetical protein
MQNFKIIFINEINHQYMAFDELKESAEGIREASSSNCESNVAYYKLRTFRLQ